MAFRLLFAAIFGQGGIALGKISISLALAFRIAFNGLAWGLGAQLLIIDKIPTLGYNVAQGDQAMTENSVVRARIDGKTKAEAAAVLGAMGLTLSDAFRLMVKRIAAEKALPFEPLVPNEKTIAAMREARAGKLPRFKSAKDLLRELNEGD